MTDTATAYVTLNSDGVEVGDSRDAHTTKPTASTIKMLNVYTARKWLTTEAALDETTVVTQTKVGSTAKLKVGDVVSVRDLFYGTMLPSGNDAATSLAQHVGAIIRAGESGPPEGVVPLIPTADENETRFVQEMRANAVLLGWSPTPYINTPWGGNDKVSVTDLARLVMHIHTEDPWLSDVMSTRTAYLDVSGPDPRTITVTHTINPQGVVKLPEFITGKTGSGSNHAGECVIIAWDNNGSVFYTGLMGADNGRRFYELRTLMDAATIPPPSVVVVRRRGASATL